MDRTAWRNFDKVKRRSGNGSSDGNERRTITCILLFTAVPVSETCMMR